MEQTTEFFEYKLANDGYYDVYLKKKKYMHFHNTILPFILNIIEENKTKCNDPQFVTKYYKDYSSIDGGLSDRRMIEAYFELDFKLEHFMCESFIHCLKFSIKKEQGDIKSILEKMESKLKV